MIDPNFDEFPQTVFTVQASDADYLASHFPWPFKGVWLSDCCLVTIDATRFARISVADPATTSSKGTSPATGEFMGQELAGMKVEIIHKLQGPIMVQSFPFAPYLTAAPGSHQMVPRLLKAKGKYRWYAGRDAMPKAPKLKDYCNAIEVFLSLMAERIPETTEISKNQHHERSYQSDDEGAPIVIED